MSYFSGGASGALSGAGTGAAIGSLGGPGGTLLGAGIGAGAGLLGGLFRAHGQKKSKNALGDARMRLEELARQQRAQREADLQRAIGYFQPVQDEMRRLYG